MERRRICHGTLENNIPVKNVQESTTKPLRDTKLEIDPASKLKRALESWGKIGNPDSKSVGQSELENPFKTHSQSKQSNQELRSTHNSKLRPKGDMKTKQESYSKLKELLESESMLDSEGKNIANTNIDGLNSPNDLKTMIGLMRPSRGERASNLNNEHTSSSDILLDVLLASRIKRSSDTKDASGTSLDSCHGSSVQQAECSFRACPSMSSWGAWSSWGTCSATCGPGLAVRRRECHRNARKRRGKKTTQEELTEECEGDALESEACDSGRCRHHEAYLRQHNVGKLA